MNSSESLVELIFTKCSMVYGRDFLSRWEGLDLDEVKADWVRELGGLLNNPQAIRHGLTNLPDKPPNVLQFRALCVNRPDEFKALPAPTATPADKERVRKMLAQARQSITGGA